MRSHIRLVSGRWMLPPQKHIQGFLALLIILIPHSLEAQDNLLDYQLEIPAQTATVKELLSYISSGTGCTFSYGRDVPLDKKVAVENKVQTVGDHLEEIFRGDSLQFIGRGKKILIVTDRSTDSKRLPTQTVRGRILDRDTRQPLIGVNVLLQSEGPQKGTITDEEGYFRFDRVPVGRHELQCSYVGYDPETIPNLIVGSGKQQVIQVVLEESAVALGEVRITSLSNKSKPVNDLTLVSGRSFSAYEVENYPGSLSDISRAAVSFPGVVCPNDGQNHMIIRGNSPKGLQWRLEGIEIPNLNHFSEIGASGGGVNVVSNNMLSGSDFLSGAFPAEYGNALSGVFDLRLRTGNNERHEQTLQVGIVGTEVMAEGPVKKGSNTTYIAQYRYSSLKLIQQLGVEMESVPDFQDFSFKLYHPTRRAGVFSLFGIGGLSHETGVSGYDMNANVGTLGLSNTYSLDDQTFLRSVIAFSGRFYSWDSERNIGSAEQPVDRTWNTEVVDYTLKGSFIVNRKFNQKHKLKAGLIYEIAFNDSYMGWHSDTLFRWYSDPLHEGYLQWSYGETFVNARERATTIQPFLNWKYRINKKLSLSTGIHYLRFSLQGQSSLEPRIGLQWKLHPRHTITAGFGIHSRKESLTLYLGNYQAGDGSLIQPNMDLELAKARHYILGYRFVASPYLHIKTELYYQDLYDIPAYPFPPYFSTINFDFGFEGNILTNYGTGYNRGVELSVEKYISNGYFFQVNGTLYESRYRNKPGELLHTKYDGSYASGGLAGKEFRVGKNREHLISISARYILAGGMRYLPIDREASAESRSTVRIWDYGFSEQYPDYFRIDLLIKFRRNRPKHSGEWSIDLMNIFNRQNMLNEYWDNESNGFKKVYQNPTLPFLNYRIQF